VAESQRTPVFYPLVALYDLSGAVAPTAVDVGKLKEKLRKVMNAFAIVPFFVACERCIHAYMCVCAVPGSLSFTHPPSLPITVKWPQGKGAVVPYLHKVLQKVADGAKAIDRETAANTVGAAAVDSDEEEEEGDGSGGNDHGGRGGEEGEAPAEAAGGGDGAGAGAGAGGRRRHRARGVPRASRTGVVTCVDFRKDGLKRYCLRPCLCFPPSEPFLYPIHSPDFILCCYLPRSYLPLNRA